MIYFSQILNAKVRDSSDVVVGRLKDILVLPSDDQYDALAFLAIKTKQEKEFIFIPYEFVEALGHSEITLNCLFFHIPKKSVDGEYLFLGRDILDQQIVDVEGARVVRVNDIDLGIAGQKMCILGLDVSFKGLLRRLGLARLDFLGALKVNLIDWRAAQPIKGALRLNTVSKKLTKLHPADLANIIEDLNLGHGSGLVKSLDTQAAAHVIEEMDPEIKKVLVKYLGADRASRIIEKMSIDDLVDLLKTFSKQDAQTYLSRLGLGRAAKVEQLISYPDNTAGGLMTTDFVSVGVDWTAAQTIEEIKKRFSSLSSILYVYVIDADGRLKGYLSLRYLIVADANQKLEALMKKATRRNVLHPENNVSQILNIMTRYNLYAAAVLDNENRPMGIVTIDDVMRQLAPEA